MAPWSRESARLSGAYFYDGAGNVTGIGTDAFVYDARSRLTKATLTGQTNPQWYCYDRYGNLQLKAIQAGQPACPTTAWDTNRISGASYDSRGNVLTDGDSYTYDALDRMKQHTTSSYKYLYDGANERQVRVPPSGSWTYTLRDGSERLATEYSGTTWSRDNVFLGNLLVASYANTAITGNTPPSTAWTFYASDHLGTPRLVTDIGGTNVETRQSWPFGEDATTPASIERVRFASMERDTEGSRYYDHARQHEYLRGRFISPDKLHGDAAEPQTWNRYAYVNNSPLLYVDPTGQAIELIGQSDDERRKALAVLQSAVGSQAAARLYINEVREGDKTRYFVGITGDVAEFNGLSPTARGLSSLVADKKVVEYGLTAADLSKWGGSATYEPSEKGNANTQVLINPDQIAVTNSILNPNSLLGATTFGGWNKDPRWVVNPFTVEVNTWHEFGHAWGLLHGKSVAETKPDALLWENKMRQFLYGPIGPANAPRIVHN